MIYSAAKPASPSPPVSSSRPKSAARPANSPSNSTSGEMDAFAVMKGALEALQGHYSQVTGKIKDETAPWEWMPSLGEIRTLLMKSGATGTTGLVAMLESTPIGSWDDTLANFCARREVASDRMTGAAVLSGYASSVSLPAQDVWRSIEVYTDVGVISKDAALTKKAAIEASGKKPYMQLNPAFYPGVAEGLWNSAKEYVRIGMPVAVVFGVSAALKPNPSLITSDFVNGYRKMKADAPDMPTSCHIGLSSSPVVVVVLVNLRESEFFAPDTWAPYTNLASVSELRLSQQLLDPHNEKVTMEDAHTDHPMAAVEESAAEEQKAATNTEEKAKLIAEIARDYGSDATMLSKLSFRALKAHMQTRRAEAEEKEALEKKRKGDGELGKKGRPALKSAGKAADASKHEADEYSRMLEQIGRGEAPSASATAPKAKPGRRREDSEGEPVSSDEGEDTEKWTTAGHIKAGVALCLDGQLRSSDELSYFEAARGLSEVLVRCMGLKGSIYTKGSEPKATARPHVVVATCGRAIVAKNTNGAMISIQGKNQGARAPSYKSTEVFFVMAHLGLEAPADPEVREVRAPKPKSASSSSRLRTRMMPVIFLDVAHLIEPELMSEVISGLVPSPGYKIAEAPDAEQTASLLEELAVPMEIFMASGSTQGEEEPEEEEPTDDEEVEGTDTDEPDVGGDDMEGGGNPDLPPKGPGVAPRRSSRPVSRGSPARRGRAVRFTSHSHAGADASASAADPSCSRTSSDAASSASVVPAALDSPSLAPEVATQDEDLKHDTSKPHIPGGGERGRVLPACSPRSALARPSHCAQVPECLRRTLAAWTAPVPSTELVMFYHQGGPWYELSNFYVTDPYPVDVSALGARTAVHVTSSEHEYQALKTAFAAGFSPAVWVARAASPAACRAMANNFFARAPEATRNQWLANRQFAMVKAILHVN